MTSFANGKPVTCVRATATAELDAQLGGVRTLRLDGSGVADKAGFLSRVERDLPMPPGLHPHNWDALADCLWGSFTTMDDDEVAIVWERADELLDSSLSTFLQAVDTLNGLARSALTTEYGFSHPMVVRLFLVGKASSFDDLP
jgi:hypothetical protein